MPSLRYLPPAETHCIVIWSLPLKTGQVTNYEWKKDMLGALDFELWATVDPKYEKVKTLLATYDLNDITPLKALQILDKIKDELK